ncbi:hypothetical protein ACU4GI_33035 [Cupriavidus basilensis]
MTQPIELDPIDTPFVEDALSEQEAADAADDAALTPAAALAGGMMGGDDGRQ